MILTFWGPIAILEFFVLYGRVLSVKVEPKCVLKKHLIEATIDIINISEIVVDIGVQAVIYAN